MHDKTISARAKASRDPAVIRMIGGIVRQVLKKTDTSGLQEDDDTDLYCKAVRSNHQ